MLIRAFFVIMILLFNIGCNIYAREENTIVKGGYKECIVYKTEYKSGKLDGASRFKELHCYYDSTGKTTMQLIYYPNGSVDAKEVFFYDSIGRIDTVRGYRIVDTTNFDYYKFYVYDNEGKLTQSGMAHSDVHNTMIYPIFNKETSKYDKNGHPIERIANDFGKNPSKFNYKYDKKGNQIEETISKLDGSVFNKTLNKYDKKKNLIEKITYHKNDNLDREFNHKFTYKYDSYGNITEEIRFLQNLKEPTEKREYIYFPNILNKVSK